MDSWVAAGGEKYGGQGRKLWRLLLLISLSSRTIRISVVSKEHTLRNVIDPQCKTTGNALFPAGYQQVGRERGIGEECSGGRIPQLLKESRDMAILLHELADFNGTGSVTAVSSHPVPIVTLLTDLPCTIPAGEFDLTGDIASVPREEVRVVTFLPLLEDTITAGSFLESAE